MKNQYGQSMTEFLIVFPVMLLLIFGCIQFILIYQTKTTLNYATFEAARAGSLGNASREAVDNGFTRGIAPLFSKFATTGNNNDDLAEKVLDAREYAREEIKNGFVKIELLNPTPAMFQAFDENTIPNDHLSFRSEKVNKIPIQDMNLLKIRITYCMKLIVPLVNDIITGVSVFSNSVVLSDDSAALQESRTIAKQCPDSEDRRFPIVSFAIIRMQSAAEQCKGSSCFD